MYLPNSDLIMSRLPASATVLDIGGWAHPFNRANYVMDAEPYETRGYYNRTFARANPLPPLGGTVEHFAPDTWIRRDICDKTPYPFADKSIDLVICSHTLEDIRDPLWVCSEMIRIGKAGYVEVPLAALGELPWAPARHRGLVSPSMVDRHRRQHAALSSEVSSHSQLAVFASGGGPETNEREREGQLAILGGQL